MRARREVHLFLFALAVIGVLGEAHARPSEGLGQLEDYPEYEISERQKQEDGEGSPGSAGSEGTFASWWSERRPCSCANSRCGCCTGTLFPLPPWLRPRVCTNLTYIEDEFALKMAVSFNSVVMYRNKVSGRNPPPVCISPPRLSRAKLCIKLQDVYLIDRNMHACLSVEGLYNKQVLFGRMLGCMRMGANGFAVVNPEDGGGLPLVEPADPDDEEPNDEDDYDQVDEDYDPVEEDNNVESDPAAGAVDGALAQGGGSTGATKTAVKTKGTGATKGAAAPASTSMAGEGSSETEGSVKTAEDKGTQKTVAVQDSVKATVAPVKITGPQEMDETTAVPGSVNTTEVEGPLNTTKNPETFTTGDEGLVSTTVTEEEAGNMSVTGPGASMEPGVTEGSEESTIVEETHKSTTELSDEGKKTGGRKEEDENAVAGEPWKEAAAVGGEVGDKSIASEVDGAGAEDFREAARETKGPDGSKEEAGSKGADPGPIAGKEEVPKVRRDLLDEEIMGVGTVEEL